MPRNRKDRKLVRERDTSAGAVPPDEKVARLLGVIATKDLADVNDRVALLRAVGFWVPEVASMLGITENHVRVATHYGRKKRAGKRSGSKQ